MLRPGVVGLAVCLLLSYAIPVAAHHRVGHSGRVTRPFSNPFSQASEPPATRLEYSSQMDYLDHHVGQLYAQTLTLERGFRDKLSVSLGVSFLTLSSNFGVSATGIGDLVLGVKGVVFRNIVDGHTLTTGVDILAPTGDADRGFGSDEAAANVYMNYVRSFQSWTAFSVAGATLALQADVQPSFSYTLGTAYQRPNSRFNWYLAVNGETLSTSAIYQNGGTRLFLVPGVGINLTDSNALSLNIGLQQRIVDSFDLRPGTIVFTSGSTVLNDRLTRVLFNITYGF